MSINLTKFLTAFSTSLALAALVPSISLAQTTTSPSDSTTGGTTSPLAPTTPSGSNSTTGGTTTYPNVPSGTPRSTKRPQNPQVLAVRRQEMKDILATLDQNQREKFIELVRKGKKPETALESLNLKQDQQTRIQAIISDANTKISNLKSGQPSSTPSSVPQTQPAGTP